MIESNAQFNRFIELVRFQATKGSSTNIGNIIFKTLKIKKNQHLFGFSGFWMTMKYFSNQVNRNFASSEPFKISFITIDRNLKSIQLLKTTYKRNAKFVTLQSEENSSKHGQSQNIDGNENSMWCVHLCYSNQSK